MNGSDQEGSPPLFFQKGDKPRKKARRNLRRKRVVKTSSSAKTPAIGGDSATDHINQELYKRNAELAVRNKTLALLRQLDEISLQALRTEEMGGQMTAAVANALGYDLVAVVVVHQHKKERTLQWAGAASSIAWINEVIKRSWLGQPKESLENTLLARYVFAAEEKVFIDDLKEVYSKAFVEALEVADRSPDIEEIKHSMVQPLRFGDKVLGALVLSSSRPLRELSRYEQEAVSGITGLVALALYKAELYEDLQETSDELAMANTQLRNLDKAKSEFLSIASHQLYTPLTALRGYIAMMKDGDFGKVSLKQEPILDILNKSAVRLIDLIKSLLDISRIERGKLELNLEEVDIVALARELVTDLIPNAKKKGLAFEFHAPKEPIVQVVADKIRLRQVLLNFVDNAIKYTERGRVDVSVIQQDDQVIFAVKDTGRGISREDLQRLFTKFVRVGGPARFHTEGTGLGLYVAQKIVDEHHGEVKVESPGMGKGSTFSVLLPAAGSATGLKAGQKVAVDIQAAEAEGKADKDTAK